MACVSSSSCWLPASLTFRHLRSQCWLQYSVFEKHKLDVALRAMAPASSTSQHVQ